MREPKCFDAFGSFPRWLTTLSARRLRDGRLGRFSILGSGAEALKYLRGVERAASDRMNRVRRDEVLQTVLGSVLAAEPVRELSSDDCSWMEQVDEIADRDDEGDGDETAAEEQAHLLEVLVEDNA